jgi:hypothetical protein
VDRAIPRNGTKPKGAIGFKTLKRRAMDRAAAEAGISPLEYLLQVMRAPDPEPEAGEEPQAFANRLMFDKQAKLAAARFAAPYVHARIATEVRVKSDQPKHGPVDVLELSRKIAFIFARAERERVIDSNVQPNQLQ